MASTSILRARSRAPRTRKAGKGVVRFTLYRRGNPRFRNFQAVLDADVMQSAGLDFKDPCDLRFSDDLSTCEIVRDPSGPSVTIQPQRGRGVLRTRVALPKGAPEFSTEVAEVLRSGDHAVVVRVPRSVQRVVKALSH
jgi:hypothetical protein